VECVWFEGLLFKITGFLRGEADHENLTNWATISGTKIKLKRPAELTTQLDLSLECRQSLRSQWRAIVLDVLPCIRLIKQSAQLLG